MHRHPSTNQIPARRNISAIACPHFLSAAKIVENGLLKPEELYELVIPTRTFDRRLESHQRLTVVETDCLSRAARVFVRIDAAPAQRGATAVGKHAAKLPLPA